MRNLGTSDLMRLFSPKLSGSPKSRLATMASSTRVITDVTFAVPESLAILCAKSRLKSEGFSNA
jgi:hypothetical protein